MQQRSLLLALGFTLAMTACEVDDKDAGNDTGMADSDDGAGDGDGPPATACLNVGQARETSRCALEMALPSARPAGMGR
ncbi:MAG: hypothetical protein ACPHRO_13795, partial [Nannocystaceae bacterium]